jgi:protein-L-isoaspartate(D-aspartate) O-methyltransferase
MSEQFDLDRDAELAVVRRAYAKQILAAVNVSGSRLETALASVKRERFLGPGPWQVFRYHGVYVATPTADPVYLYTDNVIAIVPDRRINNGQPSLHAYLLDASSLKEGEHIVHVGTGTGYYTAIMAEIVGPSGRVTGIEFDPQLAMHARSNLSTYPNVTIIEGDGAVVPFGQADVIYVNAGATGPAAAWLDRLAEGGRLILPLMTALGFGKIEIEKMAQRGAVFRILRDKDGYRAKWISPVAIFPCAGNRDEDEERALAAALEKGGAQKVTRLYRNGEIAEERCWLRGKQWCLAFN